MLIILGLNLVDIFIIVFLAGWAVHGHRRGFLIILFDFLVFLTSIYLAAKTYPYASTFLNNAFSLPRSYANLVSFIVLFGIFHFILGIIFVRYLYGRIIGFLMDIHLSLTDKILGTLLALIGGAIWLSIILGIFTWFPISVLAKDQVTHSRIGAPIVKKASKIEPQVEKIAGQAIDDTIGFATPQPKDSNWRPNIPSGTRPKYDPADELYMLKLVNKERGMRGLKSLVFDARLRDVARSHSMDMVKNNYFNHDSPTAGSPIDRLNSAGIIYFTAGENIAYAQDIDLAHDNLMASKEHRENILSPYYGRIGIGIVNAGPFGYMITQDFIN